MAKIIIFRGKAATGKTTLSDLVSSRLHIPVLRNDDVLDRMFEYLEGQFLYKNKVAYDILTSLININLDNDIDLVVDVGLVDNPSFLHFFEQLKVKGHEVHQFFCSCSDIVEWRRRLGQRLSNPHRHWLFDNVEDYERYFNGCKTSVLLTETVLDSKKGVEELYGVICKQIDFVSCLRKGVNIG